MAWIEAQKGGASEFLNSLKGWLIYSNTARRRRLDGIRHNLTGWGV